MEEKEIGCARPTLPACATFEIEADMIPPTASGFVSSVIV